MINFNTHPGISPEKDELNKSELSEEYKQLKIQEMAVSYTKSKIRQLRQQERESRGLEAAHIGRDDLIDIIEALIANKSPVSKAFAQHEVSKTKCPGWASRTIKYSVDETELRSALDTLAKNTDLILLKKYDVLDISVILSSDSYSAALTKLKKQLSIATKFQDKDNELINKDTIIAGMQTKIEELKQELLRNKSFDWQQQALTLREKGVSVKEIAARLNKSRTTVSNYLNSPSVKAQIFRRPMPA